jgi:hypothetical protein
VRVVASTNSFDLAGWEDLVPALADAPLSGKVRVQDLALVSEPLDLRGAIHLEGLTASPPDMAPVTLRGTLHGEGDALRTRAMAIDAAEQTFTLDAALMDLFGTPAYEAQLVAEDADVNALSTAFAATPDTLHGPLDLHGSVRGTLGEGSPLETLRGDIDFGIEKGRLVGVSLLEATFGELGALGSLGRAGLARIRGRGCGARVRRARSSGPLRRRIRDHERQAPHRRRRRARQALQDDLPRLRCGPGRHDRPDRPLGGHAGPDHALRADRRHRGAQSGSS